MSTSPLAPGGAAAAPLTNWAGNVEYGTRNVHFPASVDQVQEVVRNARSLRALGSRHSFNRIADSIGTLVSLRRMNSVVSLDTAANTVTVQGGMRYGELSRYLHGRGYALHNLPSHPHISVAGACATATHGSGSRCGNLATAVATLEFVDAAGEVVTLSRQRDGDAFQGAVVALGGLGVTTKLTLDVQPTFHVAQLVYLDLPMEALEHGFAAIMASGYSVSLFTDWTREYVDQVWIKTRVREAEPAAVPGDFHGARPAARDVHPVRGEPAANCTPQMGVPGPWHERLPHFRMGHKPSVGRELQSEYFVPLEHAWPAMRALAELREHISPLLFVSEIRTIAADGLWMSPCHGRPCAAVHMTWKAEWEPVARVLPLLERTLARFDAVPHWGKLFTLSPAAVQSRYPRLGDFRELLRRYDPRGKFRNAFLSRNLYA